MANSLLVADGMCVQGRGIILPASLIFDVIVAGGGTAGCVAAAHLAQSGRRVLLVEAGPDYGALDAAAWPVDLLDASKMPSSHDWGYAGDVANGRKLSFERARVIGGCSAHNGCAASWGHWSDYDTWEGLGLPGWGASHLLPLFRDVSLRLRVRRFSPRQIAPLHQAFLDAGVGLGLPHADLLETLDPRPSICAEPSNSPDGVRWNTAIAYLDSVRAFPQLMVRADSVVDKVLLKGRTAVGIRAMGPGGTFEALSEMVVLTAGTYGTPAILQRSGIGPANALDRLGVQVVADSPGVGANLHDHPGFELRYRVSAELERRTAAFVAEGHVLAEEQVLAAARSRHAQGGFIDLHLFSELMPDRTVAIFAGLLTPRSRGRLLIRDLDPEQPPMIGHAYLTDPDMHDLRALVDGVELAREFAAQAPLASFLASEAEPTLSRVRRTELERAVRHAVVHYWHPVGTCAMGPGDDPMAVCDAEGKVRGVDHLMVADAAVMPTIVRATTAIPVCVVAQRIISQLVASEDA